MTHGLTALFGDVVCGPTPRQKRLIKEHIQKNNLLEEGNLTMLEGCPAVPDSLLYPLTSWEMRRVWKKTTGLDMRKAVPAERSVKLSNLEIRGVFRAIKRIFEQRAVGSPKINLRDFVFARNIRAAIEKTPAKKITLICGGEHFPGVGRFLTDEQFYRTYEQKLKTLAPKAYRLVLENDSLMHNFLEENPEKRIRWVY